MILHAIISVFFGKVFFLGACLISFVSSITALCAEIGAPQLGHGRGFVAYLLTAFNAFYQGHIILLEIGLSQQKRRELYVYAFIQKGYPRFMIALFIAVTIFSINSLFLEISPSFSPEALPILTLYSVFNKKNDIIPAITITTPKNCSCL